MSRDYPDREHWLKVRKAQRDPGYKALLTRPDVDPKTGKMVPLKRSGPKEKRPGQVRRAALSAARRKKERGNEQEV